MNKNDQFSELAAVITELRQLTVAFDMPTIQRAASIINSLNQVMRAIKSDIAVEQAELVKKQAEDENEAQGND